jgi:hypothetical protein
MHASITPDLRPAPAELASAALAWTDGLRAAVGDGFRALYIYGSALGSSFDPKAQDVNLLLVVDAVPYGRLEALAAASAKLPKVKDGGPRFMPLLLDAATLSGAVDVFPMEFLDLGMRRALIAGNDVLAGVEVPLRNLRHQCEYELRSKYIGLRQAYLRGAGGDGTAQWITARAAGSLGAVYRNLLALRGRPRPDDDRELAAAVAAAFGVDAEGLDAPFAARREPAREEAVARRRFARALEALEHLIHAVDADPAR